MAPLYPTAAPESIRWPEPFESTCQAQRCRCRRAASGARRPDIGPPLRLMVTSAVALGDERLIVSRDELYMGQLAWLLTVDTASYAILSGHVETEADAETWALSLALDAVKIGGRIEAIAEDGAKCYGLSVRLVESLLDSPFRPDVRKDHWHLLRQARRTLRDADRIALKHLETAERKASQVRPGLMQIRDFAGWEEAHARAERAVTNGHRHRRDSARRAAAHVQALCHADPVAQHLAECLHVLLDGTVRTSAASENVNSILRAYLWGRRHFRDRRTAQNWLNLLVLWYNLQIFERGKRAGTTPFQLAGVTVRRPDGQPTDNWLEALGYATAA